MVGVTFILTACTRTISPDASKIASEPHSEVETKSAVDDQELKWKDKKNYYKVDGVWVEVKSELEMNELARKKINTKDLSTRKSSKSRRIKATPNVTPNLLSEEIMQKIELLRQAELVTIIAQFEVGSPQPIMNEEVSIPDLVKAINASPNNRYVLVGHTNSKGNATSNIMLSVKRAEEALSTLVSEYGLESGRLQAVGAGEEMPLLENDSKENRAKNSRVELRKFK